MLVREIALTDAPFILELLNTPSYLQFIGDKNVRSIKEAENHIKNDRIKSYQTNGFGLWLVELRSSCTPIGTCGLLKREGTTEIDIGFAFHPAFFNKGYAFEAAKATLNYAYEKLKFKKVVAYTNKENSTSIALLKKLGLRFEKTVNIFKTEDVLLFSLIKKPN